MNQCLLSWSSLRRSGFFLLTPLLGALLAAPAQVIAAEQQAAKKSVSKAEPVIVTATRIEQPVSTVTQPYSIVDEAEITVRKQPQAIEYLRDLPGVTVVQAGTKGRQADVSIRGANTNQTLVLIDGARVASPTQGLFNFNSLSSENIERIEVIRGPQSALYGSDAIGGVVNIITKKGKGAPQATTLFEYGTQMTFHEAFTAQGATDHFNLSGSFDRFDTEGRSVNDEFDSTSASARMGVDIAPRVDLDATFRYNKNKIDIDDGAFRVDPNRFTRNKDVISTAKLHAVAGDEWDHTLQFSQYHNAQISVDPPDPGVRGNISSFKLDSNIYDINYFNTLPLWDFMTLTTGLEYEYQYANNKTFKRILRTTGVYGEGLMQFGDRVNVSTGVRIENSKFGVSTDPHFSAAYRHLETGSKIRGEFGTGFRAPTLNQLFFPNFGNPNLDAESSKSYGMGWEQEVLKNATFELDLFHTSIKNLIQAVPTNGVSLATNTGKAIIDGMELQTKWRFGEALNLRLYYDLLLTQDKSVEGKELTRRPKHAGGVAAELNFWNKWTAYANWVLVGTRKDRTGLAGRPSREVSPAYENLEITLTYHWNEWAEIFGRIENVTSRFYSEVLGFPNDGTLFFIGAKIQWEVPSTP